MALPPTTRPKGPIKSERNRAAAAASAGSSSVGSASTNSSAFHKKRAQGRGNHGSSTAASTSSWRRKHLDGSRAYQAHAFKQEEQCTATPRREQLKSQANLKEEASQKADEQEENDVEGIESAEDEDIRTKTALSLSGHQLPPLSALVDTLSQFRYLQRLDLSSIETSDASPSGLNTLAWLAKAVFRSKASTKGKSRAFGDNLTWINLSSNPSLTSDACIGLEALEELCVLTISHCALTSVPPSINPLRNLKALVLNNNSITSLPKSFPHLPELNSLILSHNEIETLPASLPASLPGLKKLSLGHNKLKGSGSLPDFSLCLALREVRLNDNPELKALPSHVRNWGKGADGKTAPGLELLELKDCGLDAWKSLSTLAEAESDKESQPRLRRKGLTQLLLKGNAVAQEDGYKERILQVHPTLRVLDNERLQPRVRPADKEAEEQEGTVDITMGKQGSARGDKKKQDRPQRAQRNVEVDMSEEEDVHEAAQMAAEMRALRRNKPAPERSAPKAPKVESEEDDDDEAAQMAAEMRALRRGQAPPSNDKKNISKAKANDRHASKKKITDSQQAARKSRADTPAEEEDDRSKPKHKRGSRAGKKINKSSTDPSADSSKAKDTQSKKYSTDKNGGFFEEVDAAAEKARLAPIYELSKKRAKIASGRTEVAEGVLEDATASLSKARQKETKGRTELDTFDDNSPVEAKSKPVKGQGKKKQDEEKNEKAVVNTSVAGIIDLRKQAKAHSKDGENGKKRKANEDEKAAKKKPRASLPFVTTAASLGQGSNSADSFGTGTDAWGDAGAWA